MSDGWRIPRTFPMNGGNVEDARESIRRCNDISKIYQTLDDECRRMNRKTVIAALNRRARELEEMMI